VFGFVVVVSFVVVVEVSVDMPFVVPIVSVLFVPVLPFMAPFVSEGVVVVVPVSEGVVGVGLGV
jgi:hypothetical protein